MARLWTVSSCASTHLLLVFACFGEETAGFCPECGPARSCVSCYAFAYLATELMSGIARNVGQLAHAAALPEMWASLLMPEMWA